MKNEYKGETLIIERDEPVMRVILNRPEKRNAITSEMFAALSRVTEELSGTHPFRVLIVSGSGKAFCAGGDLSGVLENDPKNDKNAFIYSFQKIQKIFEQVAAIPIPTIASIHGYALGAGLQLALACDFRIAEQGARLGLPDVKNGIIPGLGATTRLPSLIGLARAKELIMAAEPVDAEKAMEIGLVHEVVPAGKLQGSVNTLASKLSRYAPLAMTAAKRLLDSKADLDKVAEVQVRLMCSKDAQEGIAAFFEKRQPRFIGR